jgi:hypothetical protein
MLQKPYQTPLFSCIIGALFDFPLFGWSNVRTQRSTIMLRRLLPLIFVLSALLMFACARQGVAPTNDAAPSAAKPAATQSAVATPAHADKIGVPECDDYLAKVEACVSNKVPEAQRTQFKLTIETSRKGWQQAAATAQGKATLPAICKQAIEQARTAYKSFNCTF